MKELDNYIEKKNRLILIGIILLGTALRLYHINYQSLWVDELFSIIPTNPNLSVTSLIESCKSDQPPLFFFYIHYVFKLFGYNELIGRLACATIGLVSIPVIYLLGKECGDKKAGLLAAALTTVNYFHIYYSQELRFYSMAFLLSTLSYLFFIRAYKHNRSVDYVGYILATTGLLYTHYYGMIIFLTQAFTFLILLKYRRDKKFILSALLSGVVIVIAFSLWLPVIFSGLGEVLPHIKMPSPDFFIKYFYYYTGKDALSASLFCFFIFLFTKTFFSKHQKDAEIVPVFLIIVIWIVLSYLIPYIRSVLITPMLADRYTIVTLPAWIIVFSLGWNKINNLKLKYILALVVVLSAIINLFFFKQHYTRLKKDQWREASNYVISRNTLHYPLYSTVSWHFNYYFRNQPEKVSDLYSSDLSKVDKFWFLVAHFDEVEMEAQIEKLKERFVIIERQSFFGANAVLLEQKR